MANHGLMENCWRLWEFVYPPKMMSEVDAGFFPPMPGNDSLRGSHNPLGLLLPNFVHLSQPDHVPASLLTTKRGRARMEPESL